MQCAANCAMRPIFHSLQQPLRFINAYPLQFRRCDPRLTLILALFIGVRNFTFFISLEEDNLCNALIGVDFCGQRSCITNFKGNEALPAWFEWSDVGDDATIFHEDTSF